MASDSWIKDLTNHPFNSSKIMILIFIEKPGKAIYLMKQRSKLVRSKRSSKKHPIKKRLSDGLQGSKQEEDQDQQNQQRRHLASRSNSKTKSQKNDLNTTMIDQ